MIGPFIKHISFTLRKEMLSYNLIKKAGGGSVCCSFFHLFLVPVLGLLSGAERYVGVLGLDALDDLVHVQGPFAVVPQDHRLVLDLRLQLLDLLQGADGGTTLSPKLSCLFYSISFIKMVATLESGAETINEKRTE